MSILFFTFFHFFLKTTQNGDFERFWAVPRTDYWGGAGGLGAISAAKKPKTATAARLPLKQ
jgi:hypothetical protein